MTMHHQALAALLALLALSCAGCEPADHQPLSCSQAAVTSSNAISYNAISYNAISYNAIAWNGAAHSDLDESCNGESLKVYEYLVECALASDQQVTIQVDGAPRSMRGAIGLAPEWRDGSCDEDCQGWVSACLIARINARGESVPISLRGSHPGLDLSPGEELAFPVAEARYYGDVFSTNSVAMACLDGDSDHLERVCGDDPSCPIAVQGSCAELCDNSGCRDRNGDLHHAIGVYRRGALMSETDQATGAIAVPESETR